MDIIFFSIAIVIFIRTAQVILVSVNCIYICTDVVNYTTASTMPLSLF